MAMQGRPLKQQLGPDQEYSLSGRAKCPKRPHNLSILFETTAKLMYATILTTLVTEYAHFTSKKDRSTTK